jgi:hypothetical protein
LSTGEFLRTIDCPVVSQAIVCYIASEGKRVYHIPEPAL